MVAWCIVRDCIGPLASIDLPSAVKARELAPIGEQHADKRGHGAYLDLLAQVLERLGVKGMTKINKGNVKRRVDRAMAKLGTCFNKLIPADPDDRELLKKYFAMLNVRWVEAEAGATTGKSGKRGKQWRSQ